MTGSHAPSARVAVADAILALAFMGDLSMGRPTDHSRRTAWLAARLTAAQGGSEANCQTARDVSLLRWSGCTANASGFDELFGDDVGGRDAMLSMTLPMDARRESGIVPLAAIHCEVSGDIGRQLGMDAAVEAGLRNIFERWSGRGNPGMLAGDEVPPAVYSVALASDLEIFSHVHGIDAAITMMRRLADEKYPTALVDVACDSARGWLAELDEAHADAPGAGGSTPSRMVSLELVADVLDLKLPWLAGQSRLVASCAHATALQLGLDESTAALLHRAGLIHALGRPAIPNYLWERVGRLSSSDRKRMDLMPYWTQSGGVAVPGLKRETELASRAYERLDGSGHFRSLDGSMLTPPQRVLAISVALVALRSPRPWRPAHGLDAAAAILRDEAARGLFDSGIVEAALAAHSGQRPPPPAKSSVSLSTREAEVLRRISIGESNKEVARTLAISPSTVRTHIESVFRKLDCQTRAAATLKAFTLGLI